MIDFLSKNSDKGYLLWVSIYDREHYYSEECGTKDNALKKEKEKRNNFKEQGYDVDTYDKKYHELVREGYDKVSAAKHISEADELYMIYEQKKRDLAKEYLDVEWVDY